MSLCSEYIEINGAVQWIHYFGKSESSPVILFLHGGPGTPETPYLEKYNQSLLENFVIASWEQRGAGKSQSTKLDPTTISLSQIIDDAIRITKHIKEKFNKKKIYLMGHSWGTLLGMHLSSINPSDYFAYIALAQTSHSAREEGVTIQWLLRKGIENDDKNTTKVANTLNNKLNNEEFLNIEDMSKMVALVNKYGSAAFYDNRWGYIKLILSVVTSRIYDFSDKLNYLKGEAISLRALHNDIKSYDLFKEVPKVAIPVIFFHGCYDYQVPISVAKSYFNALEAPYKRFVEMKNCAHGLLFEKPDDFKMKLLEELKLLQRDF